MRGIFLIVMKHWYNVNMEQDFNKKHWSNPCPKYNCRKEACKCGLKFVSIPAVLGDDSSESDVAPKNGLYCNTIVRYEANGHVYVYSKEGIPVLVEGMCCESDKITKLTIKNLDTYTWSERGGDGFYMISDSISDKVFIQMIARVTSISTNVEFSDEKNNTLLAQGLWNRVRNGEKFEITIPFNDISQKTSTNPLVYHPQMITSQKVYLDNFSESKTSVVNDDDVTITCTSYMSSAKVYVCMAASGSAMGKVMYDAPISISKYTYSDSTPDVYAFEVTIFVSGNMPEPI